MKILVSVKQVIDHNVRIRVKADNSGVESENVRHSMNPFCAHAVEAGVQLREKNLADELVAISIGAPMAKDVLLSALAMGADRAILVEGQKGQRLEPLHIAKILKNIVAKENPDLVLLGKQAIDDDANQTGQMLAGLLDWPQATFASNIEINKNELIVTREVDYGRAEFSMNLPAIITADLRLNRPRKTALPMVMKARKKPLKIIPISDFDVDLTPRLAVEKVSEPPQRKKGELIANIEELAKIIVREKNRLEAGQ